MSLKKYRIDVSALSGTAQEEAIAFIDNHAFTSTLESPCCFITFWDEQEDPSLYPALSGSILTKLP